VVVEQTAALVLVQTVVGVAEQTVALVVGQTVVEVVEQRMTEAAFLAVQQTAVELWDQN